MIDQLLDTLDQLVAALVENNTLTYAEASRLFHRIDKLSEQMEILVVSAKDYPDEEE